MRVSWNYDGSLTFNHTADESPDPEDHLPQRIEPHDFIVHAANLHLFRTLGHTPNELPLWSCARRNPEPSLPMAPSVTRL